MKNNTSINKVMKQALEQTFDIMNTEHNVKLTLSDLCNLQDCIRCARKTVEEAQQPDVDEELLICDKLMEKLNNIKL